MELTELLKGKSTTIKGNEYFSTEAYVTPFIERMSKLTNEFEIKVKLPDQMSITEDKEDIIYNRVNIEAILPDDHSFDGYRRCIGMVYSLDARKPVAKFYVGRIRSACLNLCVFSPEALNVQEIEPLKALNYQFVDNCLSINDNTLNILKQLEEQEYTQQQCVDSLGTWIDRCINYKFPYTISSVKLAVSSPIDAYKNIWYKKDSEYFTKDNIVSGLTLYNSFTEDLCNGTKPDINNRFEKVYLVKEILGI